MSSERATVRPVTLGRLVEVTFLATADRPSDADIEADLAVSHRRAREVILETQRLGLIEEASTTSPETYRATATGERFVDATAAEDWTTLDDLLRAQSPHYRQCIDEIERREPVQADDLLQALEARAEESPYQFNQTSIDVLCDWAERLDAVQRNVFTGAIYTLAGETVPETFPELVLETVDAIEETTGATLQQRYIPIPELRETICEELAVPRSAFDDALVRLAEQNVGRLELSGAPIDTAAKDARFGIKELQFSDEDGVVSTDHDVEEVMWGIELDHKQYYYLAIHDEDLAYSQP